MNHKYSTYTVLVLLASAGIMFVMSIDSSDIDEVCDINERVLYRSNGEWQCAQITSLSGTGGNLSYNNYNISNIGFTLYLLNGTDLSGTDGTTGRMYAFNNTVDILSVENNIMHNGYDYTYNGSIINFTHKIWDDQEIAIYSTEIKLNQISFTGASATGLEGTGSREITIQANIYIVAVDNYILHINKDYVTTGTGIMFLTKLWNDQRITVWTY